jgi:hypothetical protein
MVGRKRILVRELPNFGLSRLLIKARIASCFRVSSVMRRLLDRAQFARLPLPVYTCTFYLNAVKRVDAELKCNLVERERIKVIVVWNNGNDYTYGILILGIIY